MDIGEAGECCECGMERRGSRGRVLEGSPDLGFPRWRGRERELGARALALEGGGVGDRERVVGVDVACPVEREGVSLHWPVLEKKRGEWTRVSWGG